MIIFTKLDFYTYIIVFFICWVSYFIIIFKLGMGKFKPKTKEELKTYCSDNSLDILLSIIISAILSYVWPIILVGTIVYYLFLGIIRVYFKFCFSIRSKNENK